MSVLSDEDNSAYARYQALEQRYRGIVRHIVLSLVAGAVAGVAGTLIHVSGLRSVEQVYDPYAYFALVAIVGRTAAGIGWALLSTALAALAPMVPALVGVGLAGHDVHALGGDPATLNLLVLALIGFGLAAYAARLPGLRSDAAAGLVGGVLLGDLGGRSLPGPAAGGQAFQPMSALIVALLVLGLLTVLRRTPGTRLRALAVAVLIAGGYLAVRALAG